MNRSSWQKTITVLLLAILVLSGTFLIITSINYNQKIRNTVIEENSNVTKQWGSLTESRLNAIYEHIYDNCVYVYNSTELRSGSPMMDAIVNKKTVDNLTNKLLVSEDTDAFFVYDSESSLFLFSSSNASQELRSFSLKTTLKELCPTLTANGLGNKKWEILSLNGYDYFYKGIRLGKYVCGAVSACEKYDLSENYSVMGEDVSSFFIENESIVFVAGNRELEEHVELNNLQSHYSGDYAVSVQEFDIIDGYLAVISKPTTYFEKDYLLQIFLLVDSLLCCLLIVNLIIYTNRRIRKPSDALKKANSEVAKGNIDYRLNVEEAGSDEFKELYSSFNYMADQISTLKIEQYDSRIKEETNKLMMLRAQVRPHTFLNALTTVNNMTYDRSPEEIRKYINKFAKFTRYMLQTYSEFTTVEEELQHVENFIDLQRMRTDKEIILELNCNENLYSKKIPFLVIYTLVENSLKHNIIKGNQIRIGVKVRESTENGECWLILTEEDNGDGFTRESIEKLEQASELYTKEHLGLTNVRYTLNLMYKRNNLMNISNKEEGGAIVEIRIPEGEKNEDSGL